MIFEYPKSISEAAKILDIAKPEWAKQINLDELDMVDCTYCVLGHLFLDYDLGITSLFGFKDGANGPEGNYIYTDKIFGGYSCRQSWVEEIKSRL